MTIRLTAKGAEHAKNVVHKTMTHQNLCALRELCGKKVFVVEFEKEMIL